MTELLSAVIVSHKRGYVAHLRFSDRKHDIDLSNNSKGLLYNLVESYIYKALGGYK